MINFCRFAKIFAVKVYFCGVELFLECHNFNNFFDIFHSRRA